MIPRRAFPQGFMPRELPIYWDWCDYLAYHLAIAAWCAKINPPVVVS